MMNYLVCVKQVPDTTEIRIDPVTHTLIREGVPSILNTFDGFALETALRHRYGHHHGPAQSGRRAAPGAFRRRG